MGTRSIIHIHNGDLKSNILVSIYHQFDEYFQGVGAELQGILTDFTIVNGISSNTPKKSANGMGCLAAQLIAILKDGIGNVYIVDSESSDEHFAYHIYLENDKLKLIGKCDDETKDFPLYKSESKNPIISFKYPDKDGVIFGRRIEVIERDENYITGYDLKDDRKFKKFKVEKIIDY